MTETKPVKRESESSYELCMRALHCIDHSRASLAEFKTKLSHLREYLDRTEEQKTPWGSMPNRAPGKNSRRPQ